MTVRNILQSILSDKVRHSGIRVTGTGSVDPHARHCRAVDGAQSLASGTCPTQPWALGRWIVRLCHTVPFFWAQM